MAFRSLRPTGNPILPPDGVNFDSLPVSGYQSFNVNSGTAALALAIISAKSTATTTTPEIILPAYGCPDLVAAAVFAGARSVLVDVQPQSPRFDYEQLRAAISSNTIAIVAPTLLGIRADEQILRQIIGDRPIALIEDSAQWFPRNDSQPFFGDYVVLSFGRGKPVNVLGGGALLVKSTITTDIDDRIAAATTDDRFKNRLRVFAYNTLIQPTIYNLAEKLPFLHIGKTTYHTLREIRAMSPAHLRLLPSNLAKFRGKTLAMQGRWREAFLKLASSQLIDLCASHAVSEEFALLRYPVLIQSTKLRNNIFSRLRQCGLGASIMYTQPLIKIAGVTERVTIFSHAHNAELFANQLLTLPTHDAVTAKTINDTTAILKSELQ